MIKKRFPFIFVFILFTTFLLGEKYPFSFYPMYNHFPNWSYTFYFEDQNGNKLNELMRITHADLSHLYYSECAKQKIAYGFGMENKEHMQSVGQQVAIMSFNFKEIKVKNIKRINLFRIYNYIYNNEQISDTLLISTYHVNN